MTILAIPTPLTSELDRFSIDQQRWSVNAQPVAERMNVNEAVALAMHIFNRLMRHHQDWTDRVNNKLEPFNMEKAVEFERGFHAWAAASRTLFEHVKVLERQGHFLDQGAEFRYSIRHCPYDGISVEELAFNVSELEQGKGVSLDELKDEIRRKAAPRAAEQVRDTPQPWSSRLTDALSELCEDPVGLSEPPFLPHPLQFQIFQKQLAVEGSPWILTVYFKYAADEEHLWIAGFSFRPDQTYQEPP